MDTKHIDQMLEEAARAAEIVKAQLAGIRDEVHSNELEGPGNQRLLNFPWLGQNVPDRHDEDYSNNDCGPASLAMWLNGYGRTLSIDDVSKATGLQRGYLYTMPADLIRAARMYGINLAHKFGTATVASIKAEIDKAHPVIVLIHYGSMPTRFSSFAKGHYILITGYDNGKIVYNDPLAPDSRGGGVVCSEAELAKAMADCTLDGNTANQMLVQG